MNSLERFQSDCREIDVHISPNILNAYDNVVRRSRSPTPILAAIAKAASVRRIDPDAIFATQKDGSEATNGDELALSHNGPAEHALASLILKDYVPPGTNMMTKTKFSALPPEPRIGCCADAELGFSKLFAQLKNPRGPQLPEREPWKRSGFQIIIAGNEPIMLRKQHIPSALTLKPIQNNRQHIPAGSLMAVRLKDEEASHTPEYWLSFHDLERGEVVDAKEIAALSFMRLTPWAFPPHKRLGIALSFSRAASQIDSGYTLPTCEELFCAQPDSITQYPAARTVLRAAQVDPPKF